MWFHDVQRLKEHVSAFLDAVAYVVKENYIDNQFSIKMENSVEYVSCINEFRAIFTWT